MKKIIALLLIWLLTAGCAASDEKAPAASERIWSAGFAAAEIPYPADLSETYISGYQNGAAPEGVLDHQRASALWLEDGAVSLLLISVDCIALGNRTVQEIRERVADLGCDSVNVIATHTHAGLDTLGLWGDIAIDGKTESFMEALVDAAESAARGAYADRSRGTLEYAVIPTEGMQYDSREPSVYDKNLYQLYFTPEDPLQNGIRVLSFAAHAESLRGANRLLSRDYPGVMSDLITAETGDDCLFLPGAIGGLIMTPEFTEPFDAVQNLQITGRKMADYALSETARTALLPEIGFSRVEFDTELDNTLFMYYEFLGILKNEVWKEPFAAYRMKSELSVLQLGEITLALIPGEIFPELVFGTGSEEDPAPLQEIAAQYGAQNLIVVGLANDEIGYIVPPSDFALHPELPYLEHAEGDHYEETNSVGINAAEAVAEAFRAAMAALM